jgi:hypothetical protein
MKYSATCSRCYVLLLSLLLSFSCLASSSTSLGHQEHASPAPLSPTSGSSPADSTEARTLSQGVARRQPAESVEAFLQRVFPASFANPDIQPQIIQYAWRPSAFGKQLFFSAHDPHAYDQLYVFVLDPYQADTYAVERFEVEQGGTDAPSLAALFFADANHDGRKDLLVLVDSPLVTPTVVEGVNWQAHTAHYHTGIYGYVPAAEGQRPHYKEYPRRPDLDEVETAAQVRQFLATPEPKHKVRKPPQSK